MTLLIQKIDSIIELVKSGIIDQNTARFLLHSMGDTQDIKMYEFLNECEAVIAKSNKRLTGLE